MEDVVHDSTGSRRLPMLLLSVFSVLALVLAAVGIVGVVGHSVAQRTHEIGIRIALGAGTMDVLRLMVNSSMGWVLVGLCSRGGGFSGTQPAPDRTALQRPATRSMCPAPVALLLCCRSASSASYTARHALGYENRSHGGTALPMNRPPRINSAAPSFFASTISCLNSFASRTPENAMSVHKQCRRLVNIVC